MAPSNTNQRNTGFPPSHQSGSNRVVIDPTSAPPTSSSSSSRYSVPPPIPVPVYQTEAPRPQASSGPSNPHHASNPHHSSNTPPTGPRQFFDNLEKHMSLAATHLSTISTQTTAITTHLNHLNTQTAQQTSLLTSALQSLQHHTALLHSTRALTLRLHSATTTLLTDLTTAATKTEPLIPTLTTILTTLTTLITTLQSEIPALLTTLDEKTNILLLAPTNRSVTDQAIAAHAAGIPVEQFKAFLKAHNDRIQASQSEEIERIFSATAPSAGGQEDVKMNDCEGGVDCSCATGGHAGGSGSGGGRRVELPVPVERMVGGGGGGGGKLGGKRAASGGRGKDVKKARK